MPIVLALDAAVRLAGDTSVAAADAVVGFAMCMQIRMMVMAMGLARMLIMMVAVMIAAAVVVAVAVSVVVCTRY